MNGLMKFIGTILVLGLGFIAIEPRMYVYDNAQNRGTAPAPWGKGRGTLRIHKVTGEIQKYCYDPGIIDYWYDWWEPVGKATTPEDKQEIINYFKQLQEAERNALKKHTLPSLSLEDLTEATG